jgi:hypothetical protein
MGVEEGVRGAEDPPQFQKPMGGWMERNNRRRELFMWGRAVLLTMMEMLICSARGTDTREMGLT